MIRTLCNTNNLCAMFNQVCLGCNMTMHTLISRVKCRSDDMVTRSRDEAKVLADQEFRDSVRWDARCKKVLSTYPDCLDDSLDIVLEGLRDE